MPDITMGIYLKNNKYIFNKMGRVMDRKWFDLAFVCLASGALVTETNVAWGGVTLLAAKTNVAPKLDGIVDGVWNKGTPVTIPVVGGRNLPGGKTKVMLKALYTDTMVYFLAQYKDPTQSLSRTPWQKQKDGSWKKLKSPDAEEKGENRYSEDKLSLMWNISTPGFETKGCMVACHLRDGGDPYGKKYTPKPNERLDMWHMRAVRTAPVGKMDDQYVDGTRFDKEKSPGAGRHSDPDTGGGSKNNETKDKKMPMYALLGNKVAPPYWIFDSRKVPFDNTKYKAGDMVPSVLVAPFKGDRGNIAAKMFWKNGVWTHEIARKRVTGSEFDVQFNNLAKAYAFGVAVMDNTGDRHAYDVGVQVMKFQK
ncbi:conserved hypothetical protein [Crenothrix polyspora]|uniref:Cytochrome c-552/DMSO reductase-like haem-binding domain-containing protein n=1 Tax=Crenothrix polyspora TaxID=360316 RepID=A0A1R4H5W9_9GAMM|nr:ethylbenzene dehydrogenase-related protein [Crenothrix polyspora]SJM91668.1 conserved hypothetical protein [Crenothrix polyspora]